MAALAALTLIKNLRGPVGVTAVTHNAIRTLLAKIEELAPSLGVSIRMQHRKSDGTSTAAIQIARSNEAVETAVADGTVDVVGATSWLFSRPEFAASFDTLIVDEAGQMSLADALAVSRSARNLVLVGDPRQLAQPLPGESPAWSRCLGARAPARWRCHHRPGSRRAARPHLADAPRRDELRLTLLLRRTAGLRGALRDAGCRSSTEPRRPACARRL